MELEEKELIKLILIQKKPSLYEIEKNLEMSHEQIVQLIHSINHQLISNSVEVVDDALVVSVKCADELYGLLIGTQNAVSYDDMNFRKSLIEMELMTQKMHHSLQTLSERFYVSRNTIYLDMKHIKKDIKAQQLELGYSRKMGYQILGTEYLLRNHLAQLTRNLLKSFYGKSCLSVLHFVHEADYAKLKKCLSQIEQLTQIQLTDEQMEELPYILAVILCRIRCYPLSWSFKIEKYDIRNTIEFPIIKDCLSDFTFLKDVDILYLSLHILSSNRIESAFDFINSEEILSAIDQFVETIKNKLALQFVKETEFKEKLLLHVQPAIFRNLFGFRINNPLTDRFIKEHREIYLSVTDAVEPFEQIVGHPLSDEEIVYLSMIVLGWIYQSEESRTCSIKAVVLCPNGTSVSKLLLENLRGMFPEIEFAGAYSFRQFEQMDLDLDFIFTTKPIESKAQTIIVPPFLEPESRKQLRELVAKLLYTDASIQAKSAVSTIKDLLPKDKLYAAEALLKVFFEENKEISSTVTFKPKKQELDDRNIVIVEDSVSWGDCLDVVFAPMIARKTADMEYLSRCKDVFYRNYRQMLIGPNIYLPHTAPFIELAQPDVEIAVFKQPVIDPDGHHLRIMVGLVPSKTNEHVPLLLMLNDIFLDHPSLETLMNAESVSQVLKVFEGGEAIEK
ncbi:BglG family transcription antiterminator [Sporolactobacillus laevolacticus]|uniref:Ascorbate-specific PTS system EIIA component n=1 Tax=Sporolactobacillus laevolacticus DSM 442 TaxID=1395513 RepID=V6IYY8_9BACL|nr:BglG family transcription antiterminator [Sporolactobacillus laevolacticus]EST12667.1 transcriptional antiterminator [Sporolactobacillus laevolacticus DSM 442]